MQKVRLLPNPSTFYINEVMFSLCSVDVLFHLRKEEYFRRAEEAEADVPMDGKKPGEAQGMKDSMAELVRHVLGQRRWVGAATPLRPVMLKPPAFAQLLPPLPAAAGPRGRCQPRHYAL